MRALLDINLLIALLDMDHAHHRVATDWLVANISTGWASCPLTENGCIRIMSQPGYPNPLPPAQVAQRLAEATSTEYHRFWPDNLSLVGPDVVEWTSILGARQITDVYLLALAVHKGGRFVTFDRGIPLHAVQRASSEHLVVL